MFCDKSVYGLLCSAMVFLLELTLAADTVSLTERLLNKRVTRTASIDVHFAPSKRLTSDAKLSDD